MNAKFPDAATARKVNVDFTLAAASAFAKTLVPPAMAEGSRFRFVYCSGWATENDLQKPLRFMRDSRRIKVRYVSFCILYFQECGHWSCFVIFCYFSS